MKTFIQWLNEHKKPEGSPLAATNTRSSKAHRDRDRLARIETMLHGLVNFKQLDVARRTNNAEN
jgi:hypothetical protein